MFEKDVIQKLEEYLRTEVITQKELAKRLEWSPSDLNNILKGREPVGIKRLLHISHKLGIKFETELGETKVAESPPIYLSEKKKRVIEMMKALSEKEQDDLIDYISFLKTKQIKAG